MLSDVAKEEKEVIITGDINCNYLNKKCHRDVKGIFQMHGFQQMITVPTRITEHCRTLIDVIITNVPVNIIKQIVIPTELSDHDMVGCSRKISNQKYRPRTIKCRNYKNYNPESAINDLSKINWKYVYETNDPIDAWTFLKQALVNNINNHAPLINKRVKGKVCEWLNEEVKSSMNHRDNLMRKARKTNNEEDWQSYRSARNVANKLTKFAKRKHYQSMLNENAGKPESFWKSIKKIFPTKSKSASAKSFEINGTQTTNKSTIANGFSNFFPAVTQSLRKKICPLITNIIWSNQTINKYLSFSTFKLQK